MSINNIHEEAEKFSKLTTKEKFGYIIAIIICLCIFVVLIIIKESKSDKGYYKTLYEKCEKNSDLIEREYINHLLKIREVYIYNNQLNDSIKFQTDSLLNLVKTLNSTINNLKNKK